MELKGIVTLDDKTMAELRENIRKEVIEDIKNKGNYSFEIEKYLNDCKFESYMRMIECTIENVIERTNEEDIHFDSGWKAWRRLHAIKSLLKI